MADNPSKTEDLAVELAPTLKKIRPYSMVPESALIDLARQVRTTLINHIPGNFVECGVWRGGSSFLMAELLRQAGVQDRKVWLCDSFEGMPDPKAIDGEAANTWAEDTKSPLYRDNCRVSLEQVQQTARELGLASYTEFVKGWFEQSLPANRERLGPIAILRIDCDWHSSVRCCLDNLFDRVVEDGFVIFDDYYMFEGCTVAVHEFFGEHRLAYPIESPQGAIAPMPAVIRKGATTWYNTWKDMPDAELLYLLGEDIKQTIPASDRVILVDDDHTRARLPRTHRFVPFLEKDGHYWGPPSDDQTAIGELARLRLAGASFIAFTWLSFWWLEHYREFHHYVRSSFPCILENDRVVLFKLRS